MDTPPLIYKKVIMEHARHPWNNVPLAKPSHVAEVRNHLCGDWVRVSLVVSQGRITQTSFESQSCALTRASASIMTETIKNRSPLQALEIAGDLESLLIEGAGSLDISESSSDLKIFEELRPASSRRACVLLPWKGMQEALDLRGNFSSKKSE